MYKWFLDRYAGSYGSAHRIWRILLEVVRRVLIMLGDPAYKTKINGAYLELPVSHKLPIYVIDYPLYDTLPGRISSFLRARQSRFSMVDVGANVGDTILACFHHVEDGFLAVEANPEFVKYLRLNTRDLPDCVLIEAFCHSGTSPQTKVRIDSSGGTARIVEDRGDLTIPKKTLNEIILENPRFEKLNFLKIDTDGNDFDILKGADQVIERAHPAILLEADIFENTDYVLAFAAAMSILKNAGYSIVIAYDNFGFLFDIFDLTDFPDFRYPLFHQLLSGFGYFDLLVLRPEHGEFAMAEKNFFLNYIQNPAIRSAAKNALDL